MLSCRTDVKMLTNEQMDRLDEMLKRYPELGRKKRVRVLALMAEYIPADRIDKMLGRNMPLSGSCALARGR